MFICVHLWLSLTVFRILTILPHLPRPARIRRRRQGRRGRPDRDPHPRPSHLDTRSPSHCRRSSIGGGEQTATEARSYLRRGRKHPARASISAQPSSAPYLAFRRRPVLRSGSGTPPDPIPGRLRSAAATKAWTSVWPSIWPTKSSPIAILLLSGGERGAARRSIAWPGYCRVSLAMKTGRPGILHRSRSRWTAAAYTPGRVPGLESSRRVPSRGNHEEIGNWRREAARDKTARNGPDPQPDKIQGSSHAETPHRPRLSPNTTARHPTAWATPSASTSRSRSDRAFQRFRRSVIARKNEGLVKLSRREGQLRPGR